MKTFALLAVALAFLVGCDRHDAKLNEHHFEIVVAQCEGMGGIVHQKTLKIDNVTGETWELLTSGNGILPEWQAIPTSENKPSAH